MAPGTCGSALGALLALPLLALGTLPYAATVVALLAAGVWSAGAAERAFGRHDDGRIVIDEVVGQLVALAPLLAFAPASPARANAPALLAGGFAAFRLFDIWKPGPVRWAERRFAGGAGVMLDDVVAGALAAPCVAAGALAWGAAS